jgi:hypothetical protein
VSAAVSDDWRTVERKLVVDHKKWVAVVDDIVVDRDTIEVLLEEVLEEGVFLLESGFLLLDGQLVKEHFVEAFVELVQVLEFAVGVPFKSLDPVDPNLRIAADILVGVVEWQNLFFLSLKLSAELGSLEDFLAQLFVAVKGFDAIERTEGQLTKVLLLVLPLARHFRLQIVVVVADAHAFLHELLVADVALVSALLLLDLPVGDLLSEAMNAVG